MFVPTPGQTEQMYLASYFMQNKLAFAMQQEKFNLTTALAELDSYNGIKHIDYSVNWQQLFAFLSVNEKVVPIFSVLLTLIFCR